MNLQRDAEQINDCIFCWASAWFMSVRRSEIVHSAPVAWLFHHSFQGSPAVLISLMVVTDALLIRGSQGLAGHLPCSAASHLFVYIGGVCKSQYMVLARSSAQHGSQGKHCRFSPLPPREEATEDLILMLEEQGEVPLAGHKGRLAVRDGACHRSRQCDRSGGI
jgi:hypothetical protein